jgi:hypothetical protein
MLNAEAARSVLDMTRDIELREERSAFLSDAAEAALPDVLALDFCMGTLIGRSSEDRLERGLPP